MLFLEGVIQLGDILRHLHSQTNQLADEETRAQPYQPRPHLAAPVSAGSHQELALAGGMQDLVKYIVSGAKANITHLASLKLSKVRFFLRNKYLVNFLYYKITKSY